MTESTPLPPSPEVNPHTKPYWDAAAAGRLLVMRCNGCGDAYVHPRPFCPFCISDDTGWFEASGKGTIYSFTITARAPVFRVPALIKLTEGPIMMSAVVDCDPAAVAIGQQVVVTFVPTADGPPLPAFRSITPTSDG